MKPGFKQTEVGVIPEEWEVQQMGKISAITTGRKDVNEGNPNGEFPFFTCSRVHTFSNSYSFDTEAILIAGNGDVGNLHYYSGQFEAYQRTYVVHKFSAHVQYLLHQLHYRLIESLGLGKIGTSIPYIKKENLTGFSFPLPPTLAEQEAIASALGDADALIESLERLVAKKRDVKQGAMQELLTARRRLPGFTGKWETKRLGTVSEMGSGGTPSSSVPAYYDGDIPWVSISDMTKTGKVIMSTDRNISRAGFTNSAAQMFPAGTVLYAMYASLGECCIAGISLCSSQAILGIRPHDILDKEFLFYFLSSIKSDVKTLGQQGTQANLNKGMVQDFLLCLPSRSEQAAITAVLSDMDAEIAALEAKLSKARAIKQGMMQELLTGRIRLK